jgi:hypothetical protein
LFVAPKGSKMKQEYRLNGELHRVGGPAVIDGNRQEWWVNGWCGDGACQDWVDGDR